MARLFSEREVRAVVLFLPLAGLLIVALLLIRPKADPEAARHLEQAFEQPIPADSIVLRPFDPNTVTFDVADAIKEIKAGRVEFRVDKTAITHNAVGKASFPVENLIGNVKALLRAIVKARPAAVKGTYIKGITVATTMGVGIQIDPAQAQKEVAAAD